MHADWKWTGDRGERALADGRVLVVWHVRRGWTGAVTIKAAWLVMDVRQDTREAAVEAVERAAGVYVEPATFGGVPLDDLVSGRVPITRETPTDADLVVLLKLENTRLAEEAAHWRRELDRAVAAHPKWSTEFFPMVGTQTIVLDPPQTPRIMPEHHAEIANDEAFLATLPEATSAHCNVRSASNWWCTRQPGHDGHHLADDGTRTLDSWPQTALQAAVGRDALRAENERLTKSLALAEEHGASGWRLNAEKMAEFATLRRDVAEECAVACATLAETELADGDAFDAALTCETACRKVGGAK